MGTNDELPVLEIEQGLERDHDAEKGSGDQTQ